MDDYKSEHDAISRLGEAATEARPVSELTHNFYRYPARFSNYFAREAIAGFSRPSQIVMDPFMGGGTTLVEGLAAGRRVVGTDISQLAHFVSQVKTTPLDLRRVRLSCDALHDAVAGLDLKRSVEGELAVRQHLRGVHWQLQRTIEQLRAEFHLVSDEKARRFLLCVLLRTGQWGLDNKLLIPSVSQFREKLLYHFEEMLEANKIWLEVLRSHGYVGRRLNRAKIVRNGAAQTLIADRRVRGFGDVDLILTSPPYLGVHVLYHRWQVRGRMETAAPFWLTGTQDRPSGAEYTFIDRRAKKTQRYFEGIAAAFMSVAKMVSPRTPLIQLVSFGKPDEHFSDYLRAVELAGFEKCEAYCRTFASPQWRTVPSRRWYTNIGKTSRGNAQEVLLVHRRK